MERRTRYARMGVGPALAFAAAGLILAGCGSSPGSASGSPGGSASSASGSASKSAAGSSSTASPAQNSAGTTASLANYPIGVGDTWLYRSSLGGTVTNKMTAVTPVSGGQQVTETNTIDLAGSPSTTRNTYIFHSDGSITYPSSGFGSDVSIQGGISWPPPAAISSEQPYKSTLHITLDESGQRLSETAHITVRGAGTATVTVPAGTYQATIVEMTMSLTVKGFPVTTEVRTWLANGVGPVQSEVVSTALSTTRLVDQQKLESFTKG
jgi:hypothetical protein